MIDRGCNDEMTRTLAPRLSVKTWYLLGLAEQQPDSNNLTALDLTRFGNRGSSRRYGGGLGLRGRLGLGLGFWLGWGPGCVGIVVGFLPIARLIVVFDRRRELL